LRVESTSRRFQAPFDPLQPTSAALYGPLLWRRAYFSEVFRRRKPGQMVQATSASEKRQLELNAPI